MALKITKWNILKYILFTFDIFIFLINISLLIFTFYLIRKEYYSRATFRLFVVPFLVSIINVYIDIIMNKTNLKMNYAGHNRYGMIVRFFMFYFILTIMVYCDQREKYVIKKNENTKYDINEFVFYLGIIDIGLLIFSMILGFFVIDVQYIKQIMVKKNKIDEDEEKIQQEMGLVQNIMLIE